MPISNYYIECLNSDFKIPKQFWRKIKSITNTKEKHTIEQIRINDTILHDSLSIDQAFNHHFSSVCSTPPVSHTNDWCGNTSPPVSSSFSLRKIMPTEVPSAIMESNGNTCLTCLISHFQQMNYPSSGNRHPLHKENDVHDCNNYRPISIICSIAKILEKQVYSQLSEYLQINDILSPSQSGFRSNHSTTTA